MSVPNGIHIGFGERVCATCGKKFLITSPLRDYLYKIEIDPSNTYYYCRYTHYKAAKEEREKQKERNKAAYKKRLAKKRKEGKHGRT